MGDWGFEQLRPWLCYRSELPLGALFCVIEGPTRGRQRAAAFGVTSVYLQGIDNAEIVNAVHARRAPTMPASVGLQP